MTEENKSDGFEKLQKIASEVGEFTQKVLGDMDKAQKKYEEVMPKIEPVIKKTEPIFTNPVVSNIVDFVGNVAIKLQTFNYQPLIKDFVIPVCYIGVLEDAKWPLFLINDEKLKDRIASQDRDNPNLPKVIAEMAKEYFTDGKIGELENDWERCSVLKIERLPILHEALTLHKEGRYYASVSMLMCQIYGIADDINRLLKENNMRLNVEEKDFVAEFFAIDKKYIDNEKGRLIQASFRTESGYLVWNAMAKYLKDTILCSQKTDEEKLQNPMRNKICHGEQLNFNTKEHSLKAILTVDMLVQLAYELKYVADNKE